MSKHMDGKSSPFSNSTTSVSNQFTNGNILKNDSEEPLSENQQKLAQNLPNWDLVPPTKLIRRGGRR